jgi:phenylpropionate dioxygenase-like ring-hydroxylating dioxygenase large terminal subunit
MMKPAGWFQVGWSGDIAPGAVVAKTYFGQDIVIYRTDDGVLTALDAYCQHMGAHLGFGGTVCEDRIICPYHGWEWDREGRNVCIPYHDRPNRARRIPTWPVAERNGIVYLWHHWDRSAPDWEVPDVFESQGDHVSGLTYHDCHPDGEIRFGAGTLDPYVVLDNAADPAHFKFVHHTKSIPVVVRSDPDGHLFRVKLGFGSRWRTDPDNARSDALDILEVGVGLSFTALGGEQLPYAVIVLATTPIDDETSEMFQTVWLEHADGDEEPAQLARRMHHATHQLPYDIAIWENQRYLERPAWTASEVRGFTALRRWAERFYDTSTSAPEHITHAALR